MLRNLLRLPGRRPQSPPFTALRASRSMAVRLEMAAWSEGSEALVIGPLGQMRRAGKRVNLALWRFGLHPAVSSPFRSISRGMLPFPAECPLQVRPPTEVPKYQQMQPSCVADISRHNRNYHQPLANETGSTCGCRTQGPCISVNA